MTSSKAPCTECTKRTLARLPILNLPLCRNCQKANPHKYGFITKTRALREYRLHPEELYALDFIEYEPPTSFTPKRMQLFLHPQVQDLAGRKWGNPEPYLVALTDFPPEFLVWLLEDLERLKQLSPNKFQYLVANRLERLGLAVQLVGDVYRKDGGIDLIAYPKVVTVPFLLAVQAKHHRSKRKTGAPEVRDFHGVLASRSSQFHMGMIVTNTTFTADAKWFAASNQTLLRLRDLEDLCRWLKEDFINEHEWRELPAAVEVAPGIVIPVPRPKILTLDSLQTPSNQATAPYCRPLAVRNESERSRLGGKR